MWPRTPLAAVAPLLVVASACTDRPAPTAPALGAPSFIINGTPTGRNNYASVGALLFDFNADGVINGDDEWCTGSLIAPTMFLTAAHCVISSYTPPGTQFYVSFSHDLYANAFRYVTATGYEYDPLFGHDMGDLHDLAVVFLPNGSTKGQTAYQLPPKGILDQLVHRFRSSLTYSHAAALSEVGAAWRQRSTRRWRSRRVNFQANGLATCS